MVENNNIHIEISPELKARAVEFFNKGAQVAYALQYDYAIELYLDGLSFYPDAVEEGHKPLRETALRRQAAGGKKSGFADGSKYKKASGKHSKDALLKAEYLLSKDPGNIGHMQDIVKAATNGDYRKTVLWMADILFDANLQHKKPSLSVYNFLRDTYTRFEVFSRALQACQHALNLKPNDTDLENILRDLSAQATLQQGKYDNVNGDFRDSIKDRQAQEKLQAQEQVIRSDAFLEQAIAEAWKEYEADSQTIGKIEKLVKALCDTEQEENEKKAIGVLEKALAELDQFRFKQRIGEIKIKQLRRRSRLLQKQLKQDTNNDALKQQVKANALKAMETELEHYQGCVENYPTDMRMKFEYGKCLVRNKKYDEAIPLFQEARNDPRHRVTAMNGIGRCFFYKKWYADAVETFDQALEQVENKEGSLAKELIYNLGRAYEADGNCEEALNCYRKVVQIDYNYQDARNRVNALRNKQRDQK